MLNNDTPMWCGWKTVVCQGAEEQETTGAVRHNLQRRHLNPESRPPNAQTYGGALNMVNRNLDSGQN